VIFTPHKLLIEAAVSAPPEYRVLLKPLEVVRGVLTEVEYHIRNIGEAPFPGGEISSIQYEFPSGMGQLTLTKGGTPVKVPSIDSGSEFSVSQPFEPRLSGACTAHIKIKAADGEKIEFFQSEKGGALPGEEWQQTFWVVDREGLEHLRLLQRLVERTGGAAT